MTSKCPSCGWRFDRPVRFCYHCGAWLQHGSGAEGPLPLAPAADGPTGSCPRCHYLSPLQVNFCANCGLRLNQAPLDKKEERQRKRQADWARTTPDQRDRAKLRANVVLAVLGIVVVVADFTFLALHPGLRAAYLGPLAGVLVLRIVMSFVTIRRIRARLRDRKSKLAA